MRNWNWSTPKTKRHGRSRCGPVRRLTKNSFTTQKSRNICAGLSCSPEGWWTERISGLKEESRKHLNPPSAEVGAESLAVLHVQCGFDVFTQETNAPVTPSTSIQQTTNKCSHLWATPTGQPTVLINKGPLTFASAHVISLTFLSHLRNSQHLTRVSSYYGRSQTYFWVQLPWKTVLFIDTIKLNLQKQKKSSTHTSWCERVGVIMSIVKTHVYKAKYLSEHHTECKMLRLPRLIPAVWKHVYCSSFTDGLCYIDTLLIY